MYLLEYRKDQFEPWQHGGLFDCFEEAQEEYLWALKNIQPVAYTSIRLYKLEKSEIHWKSVVPQKKKKPREVKNVYYIMAQRSWNVRIMRDGVKYDAGCYRTEEEAQKAAEVVRKLLKEGKEFTSNRKLRKFIDANYDFNRLKPWHIRRRKKYVDNGYKWA